MEKGDAERRRGPTIVIGETGLAADGPDHCVVILASSKMPSSTEKAHNEAIAKLNACIVGCRKCARLVVYREQVAKEKRRAFLDWDYWGKPVPGFGDPRAKLLILGLAPAAHGANRTGRMFTGDRSGDFLYQALYRTSFANQPHSVSLEDGLKLQNAYISATLRCAPPANKPLPDELENCRPYFETEIELLRPRAILALGGIAMRAYLGLLKKQGEISSHAEFPFRHGASYALLNGLPRLFASYHPSQQNTFTGKLTEEMLEAVLRDVRSFLESKKEPPGRSCSELRATAAPHRK